MMYFLYDWTFWLVLLGSLLGIIAQSCIRSTFQKYSRVSTHMGQTGATVATRLLVGHHCHNTRVTIGGQTLSDHFNPRSNTVSLSHGVYDSSSIAAIGVAAHECGHAIQHQWGYFPFRLRSTLVPLANIGSQLSMPLVLLGLLLSWSPLLRLGILLFCFAVLFQLVTLPVEINASRWALTALQNGGYLSEKELRDARRVLFAAAMTYVASALSSILQLLRLSILFGNRRGR